MTRPPILKLPRTQAATAALAAALAAASGMGTALAADAASPHIRPAIIEVVQGSPLKRITLTQRAAQRLDVQTSSVARDPAGQLSVPYPALVYDNTGMPWVYTNPTGLTFIRHKVVVARIEGDRVLLSEGPEVGMKIVTVGVPQLYGAERGIGH